MRRFEYRDDKSAKFWEVEQSGTDLEIRWGRIGTAGQSQTKQFADAAKAGAALLKLVAEKTAKGYVEGGAQASDDAAPAAQAPTPPVSSKPKAAAVDVGPAPTPPMPVNTAPFEAIDEAIDEAPVETLDAQIERVFEVIRIQIASDTVPAGSAPLGSAAIRHRHGISELAAGQVHRHLVEAGLVGRWDSVPTEEAREIAIALEREHGAAEEGGPAAARAPGLPPQTSSGAVPPWLAGGEPLFLDDRFDRTRQLARATRRHPQAIAPVEAWQSWQQVRELIAAAVWPSFNGSDPAVQDDFRAAWHSLEQATPDSSLQHDAILLAMCLHEHANEEHDVGVRFVDHLVARRGLPAAVETLLAATAYRAEVGYGHGRREARIYRHPVADTAGRHDDPLSEGEWRLRSHLAAAPQDLYDLCAAKAREAIGPLAPGRQVALALLFPDLPEMAHEVIGELCACGLTSSDLHWLQLTATDPAALEQARQAGADLTYRNIWTNERMVGTLLLERGTDAVRWLAPGIGYEHAADALTRIGTPEALEALARVAGKDEDARTRFALAAQRWPAAATAALARLLGSSNKEQPLLMTFLADLLRQHPGLASQLRPWLEPAANALLDSVRMRLAPTAVASAGDLPEVLVNPPWMGPKKKAFASVQLPALTLPVVEHWEDGEKAGILGSWYVERYKKAARAPEAMAYELGFPYEHGARKQSGEFTAARDAIARGDGPGLMAAWRNLASLRHEGGYGLTFDGAAAAHLPPEIGIPLWNLAAGEASHCYGVEFVAATWGLAAFPGVLACICRKPGDLLQLGLHYGAVELAPTAARAFAKLKTLRAVGREWLERYPEHAACGLIAPALGKPGEARDCAAIALRHLASAGHAALLDEVAGRYGRPEVLPALRAVLDENPLDRYPARRPALPAFWKPTGWTRPVLHDGKVLPDAALDLLGTMMAFPTTEEVYAGLHQVKAACTADSLADFAWDCFVAWLLDGAPSKEGWALTSLGVLGTDDTARKLTAYIRAWPGEAAHARAVIGLDVLAAIGTDVALMLLNGVAQKIKFKGLQDKAREKIAAIADSRGLSPEELEDRLAPDLGLDEGGSMVLDFGPRAFKVGFDESLKPYVREWQDGKVGARLADLPKPKKSDDAQLAKEAVERFKLLKKDVRTVASQQVLRLEAAMCTRRRWSAEVFARFIADHPLVRHLARRLVWGAYLMPVEGTDDDERRVASHGGALQACFRVAEDGQYTTADDDPLTLPADERIRIGLPHALELPADQAAAFGQLLADYELVQPFPQLGRDTHALDVEEHGADALGRWYGIKVPTGKVLGLTHIGWRRGPAQDGGSVWTFEKPLHDGRTLELALDPGIIAGMADYFPEQTLGCITLGSGERLGRSSGLSSFDTLDAIAVSELIRDMERLRS